MQFLNRDKAQQEEMIAAIAAITAQAEEVYQTSLAGRIEDWRQRLLVHLGISMDLDKLQKIVIEFEPYTRLPVLTITCQPKIDVEKVILAEIDDERGNHEREHHKGDHHKGDHHKNNHDRDGHHKDEYHDSGR